MDGSKILLWGTPSSGYTNLGGACLIRVGFRRGTSSGLDPADSWPLGKLGLMTTAGGGKGGGGGVRLVSEGCSNGCGGVLVSGGGVLVSGGGGKKRFGVGGATEGGVVASG